MDIPHSFKITSIGQLNQERTKKTNVIFSKKWTFHYNLSETIRLKIHKLMRYFVTNSILTVIIMITIFTFDV